MENIMDLYQNVDIFLLIFCRIFFSLVFLPIMTETQLPALARAGLGFILSIIVYSTPETVSVAYNTTLLGFGILAVKEMLFGLILSYVVSIFFNLYHYVGFLLGIQGGLSMNVLFDPSSSQQVPTLGKFYALGFSTVFIVSGGYHWFIKSLVDTFNYIPIGTAVFNPNMIGSITHMVAVFFEVGFKLASPILAVIFVIDCALGILARTVPQMNMFVVGIPLKIILLFTMLIIIMPLISSYNNIIIEAMKDALTDIMQGLMPK